MNHILRRTGSVVMIYISLINMNQDKQEEAFKFFEDLQKKPPENVKVMGLYFLLGEYDACLIYEAPTPTVALKLAAKITLFGSIKTLTAIPFSESKEELEGIYWYKRLENI